MFGHRMYVLDYRIYPYDADSGRIGVFGRQKQSYDVFFWVGLTVFCVFSNLPTRRGLLLSIGSRLERSDVIPLGQNRRVFLGFFERRKHRKHN
jgi:hypothetical protein